MPFALAVGSEHTFASDRPHIPTGWLKPLILPAIHPPNTLLEPFLCDLGFVQQLIAVRAQSLSFSWKIFLYQGLKAKYLSAFEQTLYLSKRRVRFFTLAPNPLSLIFREQDLKEMNDTLLTNDAVRTLGRCAPVAWGAGLISVTDA